MDFYDKAGKMALGSRLRRLSESLTEQAASVYAMYNIDLQPKWFPVFYALSDGQEKSITEIAQEIGHSHPSVSTMAKEMMKKGLISTGSSKTDGRKNNIRLSDIGQEVNRQLQVQCTDVNEAIERAFTETQYDIWKAIEEWEFLLAQKDLLSRVREEKKRRESQAAEVIDYDPAYSGAFKQLNEEWITRYFKMEASDYLSLDHPKESILDKGGQILIALYDKQPVGTCALIKMDDNTYEMAKMAVAADARGKGIGLLLGKAAIEKARARGARRLFLESNTILKPAIALYHKLGFQKMTGIPSPYERCNIQMDLIL